MNLETKKEMAASPSQNFKGKIINYLEFRHELKNKRLTLWASEEVVSSFEVSKFKIVDIFRLYPNGTFTGKSVSIELKSAFITVEEHPETAMEVRLENDKIPEKIIIVYPKTNSEYSEGDDSHDCDCDNETPRLPETEDLILNGEDFSNDLGGGCQVNFKPNRSLEEIKFSTIVRTTDPDIQKYTLTIEQQQDFLEELLTKIRITSEILTSVEYYTPLFEPKEATPQSSGFWELFSQNTNANSIENKISAFVGHISNQSSSIRNALLLLNEQVSTYSPESDNINVYKTFLNTFKVLGGGTLGVLNRTQNFYNTNKSELKFNILIGRLPKFKIDLFSAAMLVKKQLKTINKSYSNDAASRVDLDVENPIDWDESPTIYQATTIANGHVLCFHMRWKADGYSLGEVKYSKSLGPCEKEQVAILDWNRNDSASRSESLNYKEGLQARLSRDRDVNEIVNASLYENISGKSAATTAGFGTGSGGAAAGQYMGIMMGGVASLFGSMGVSGSIASQKATRSLSSNTMQKLKDKINQNSQAMRSQRSMVIQSASQNESVQATTKVISNKNKCHSVNYLFFEILKHYAVEQELVDVRECLFIPMKITSFNAEKAIRWKNLLQPLMHNKELYLGFDALEDIENGVTEPSGILGDQNIIDFQGQLRISFDIPMPDFNVPEIEDIMPWAQQQADDFMSSTWNSFFPIINRKYNYGSPYNFYKQEFWKKRQRDKVRVWETKLLPIIVEEFVEGIRITAVSNNSETDLEIDVSQLTKYKKSKSLDIGLSISDSTPTIRRSDINRIKITTDNTIPVHSNVIVTAGSLSYRSESYSTYIFRKSRIKNDLSDQDSVSIVTPMNRKELTDPSLVQIERAQKLLTFLNDHLIEMHQIIFSRMSKNKRYMMLDGIKLNTANDRSVASLVENEIVDVIGNCLVMPVNHGLRIDPVFKETEDLFEVYNPDEPKAPFRVSLPTGGYFMEAVQGTCNSCEEIDYTKAAFNNLSCGDEPTAIEPVSTSSRNVTAPDLQSKDFPASIVNYQAVPQAPAPADLASVLSLLGKGDAFKDLTGLTENQKNALAALQKNADSAVAMGQMATDLVKAQMGQQMERSIDRDLNRIDSQKTKGNISEEDAKNLTMDLLSNKNNTSKPTASVSSLGNDTDKSNMLETLDMGMEAIDKGAGSVTTRDYAPDGSIIEMALTESENDQNETSQLKPLTRYDSIKIKTNVLTEYNVYPDIVERIMELDPSDRFFDLIETDKGYVKLDLKHWEYGEISDRPELSDIYDTYAEYINKYIDYRNQLLYAGNLHGIGIMNEQIDLLYRDALARGLSNSEIAYSIDEKPHEKYHPYSDSFNWLLLAGFLVHEKEMRFRNIQLIEEEEEKLRIFREEPPQEWIDYVASSNNISLKYWFCCVSKVWTAYLEQIDVKGDRYLTYTNDLSTGATYDFRKLPDVDDFFNGQKIYPITRPTGSKWYYKHANPQIMYRDLNLEVRSYHDKLFSESVYRTGYNSGNWWMEIGFDKGLEALGNYIPSGEFSALEPEFQSCQQILE